MKAVERKEMQWFRPRSCPLSSSFFATFQQQYAGQGTSPCVVALCTPIPEQRHWRVCFDYRVPIAHYVLDSVLSIPIPCGSPRAPTIRNAAQDILHRFATVPQPPSPPVQPQFQAQPPQLNPQQQQQPQPNPQQCNLALTPRHTVLGSSTCIGQHGAATHIVGGYVEFDVQHQTQRSFLVVATDGAAAGLFDVVHWNNNIRAPRR